MNLFPGRFSADSIKGQFERSLRTFNWLVAFECFTGGGGDADLCDNDSNSDADDTKKQYKIHLRGARSKGLDVGGLTAKAIVEWYDSGWYDLFHNR